jgi:GntR family transcriptional regulator
LDIRIDPDSRTPIFLQIARSIEHQVATERLKPGQRLPTQRELANELHIDPNTAARAYDQLNADQVISTQQGRGTFVRERPNESRLLATRQAHLQTLVDGMIRKAYSLGYSDRELRAAIRNEMARWRAAKAGGLGTTAHQAATGVDRTRRKIKT